MDTKFSYGFSKEITDSNWKHLVNIELQTPFSISSMSGVTLYKAQQDFLQFMIEHYGDQDKRFNCRWTDYGVDIRFKFDSDAGSFIMFHTKNMKPKWIYDAIGGRTRDNDSFHTL